jgi:thiol-disulfide isomerase/thioredoxin
MTKQAVNFAESFKIFNSKFKNENINIVFEKYIYINIWSLGCQPCIKELPFINSLKDYIEKKINYICVSSHSDNAVNNFLSTKKIAPLNLVFINGMQEFILSVFNEIDIEGMVFPTHVVMKKNGEILAFYNGSIHTQEQALPIINFIKNLP